MGTLSNNTKVGDKGKDLILQTSGKVYVNVKDRFYPINFNGDEEESKENEQEKEAPSILFIEDESELETYTYPGDDRLIISKDGAMYKTENEEYIPISINSSSNSNIFDTPIIITSSDAPFIISSNKLVKNLNAEYLNGIRADKFLLKDSDILTFSKGKFESIFVNTISDENNKTLIDLNNSNLTIDTINVKNINIISEGDDNSDNDDEDFSQSSLPVGTDIINNKTYIGSGFKILSSNIVDKGMYYFNPEFSVSDNTKETQLISYNENAEVGGFSIYTLIEEAYNNNYIDNTLPLFEYINLLTSAYKLENGEWIPITVTDKDLIIDDKNDSEIPNFKFIPKARDIFEQVTYGNISNCAIKIYDRWFDINNCPEDIKNKYTGLTFECKIENNIVNAGEEVFGTNSNGKIEGLVVGGTENKIRIIVTGIDCEFLYLNEDYSDTPEVDPETGNIITNPLIECKKNNDEDKGTIISADIEIGDILMTKSSNNIIGNLSGVENSIFGTLEGYGFASENNCYFVNPGIALVNTNNVNYLKLTNKEKSFIGINGNNENFITIYTNGNCDMKRDKMYNINNHEKSCSFGQITVQNDGSVTIGNGEIKISISENGEINIPPDLQWYTKV